MLDEEGRPLIVNPLVGIAVLILVILIYVVLVPFSFVFKVDGEVVYTQKEVSLYSNFEKNAADSEGSEAVYGEDSVKFYFDNNEEKLEFTDSGFKLRLKMALLAVKNFVTFNWDKEDFVIEMNAG